MKMLSLGILVLGSPFSLGCAFDHAATDDEAGGASGAEEAELRKLQPSELAGTIACGETKRVRHPGTPTYRALAIDAERGQRLDLRVSAPGHDAVAWVTTASNATRAFGDDEHGDTRDARVVYTARSTGKHHVVFREKNRAKDVDFEVSLACAGEVANSDDPFDAASCVGEPITHPEAVTLIGAGNGQRIIAPATKLSARKRSCNAVTGCGGWGAPAPATERFYMASAGSNSMLDREFDVHFAFGVNGTSVDAIVQDVSDHDHCPGGCSPRGVSYSITQSMLREHHGASALFVRYPQWVHGSSGFFISQRSEAVALGPAATTEMHVTKSCARMAALSMDRQTEYAVLFRY
jgi:hypothetical protein